MGTSAIRPRELVSRRGGAKAENVATKLRYQGADTYTSLGVKLRTEANRGPPHASRTEAPRGRRRVGSPSLPTMSTPARRRLMRDFKRMQNDPPEGVNGAPQDNDIMKWHAVIFGCMLAHTCAPPSHTRPIEAPTLDTPGALA